MDYSCGFCGNFSSEKDWNIQTEKVVPQFFVAIGQLGWYHSSYICPKCQVENAGYEMKSELEYLKTFKLHWFGGGIEEVQGKDITDAFRRAGYRSGELTALQWFEQV